jgi:hypothetical protein
MKNMKHLGVYCWQIIFFLLLSSGAMAVDINQEKSQLKVDVDALGRDIAVLEKNVLLPAASRVEVFLSMVPDLDYKLGSVILLVDGKEVAKHDYSSADIKSLRFGGLHTLWQGNLQSGSHKLQADFYGFDRKDKPVQNTASLDFEKVGKAHALELTITSAEEGNLVVHSIKDWGDQ